MSAATTTAIEEQEQQHPAQHPQQRCMSESHLVFHPPFQHPAGCEVIMSRGISASSMLTDSTADDSLVSSTSSSDGKQKAKKRNSKVRFHPMEFTTNDYEEVVGVVAEIPKPQKKKKEGLLSVRFEQVQVHYHNINLADINVVVAWAPFYPVGDGPFLTMGDWYETRIYDTLEEYEEEKQENQRFSFQSRRYMGGSDRSLSASNTNNRLLPLRVYARERLLQKAGISVKEIDASVQDFHKEKMKLQQEHFKQNKNVHVQIRGTSEYRTMISPHNPLSSMREKLRKCVSESQLLNSSNHSTTSSSNKKTNSSFSNLSNHSTTSSIASFSSNNNKTPSTKIPRSPTHQRPKLRVIASVTKETMDDDNDESSSPKEDILPTTTTTPVVLIPKQQPPSRSSSFSSVKSFASSTSTITATNNNNNTKSPQDSPKAKGTRGKRLWKKLFKLYRSKTQ